MSIEKKSNADTETTSFFSSLSVASAMMAAEDSLCQCPCQRREVEANTHLNMLACNIIILK